MRALWQRRENFVQRITNDRAKRRLQQCDLPETLCNLGDGWGASLQTIQASPASRPEQEYQNPGITCFGLLNRRLR